MKVHLYDKIISPHITEKSTNLSEHNKIIFKVPHKANKNNLKKISNIVHPIVRKKMNIFFKKNNKKKIVVLDIPLLVENKLFKKKDVLIFVDAKKKDIELRLKKRFNYNKTIFTNLRKFQKPLSMKKKLSSYIIKNNFRFVNVRKKIKLIKSEILNDRNSS